MMMETVPAGTVLHGRYRIERVLGSGGFGHVYLAVDLQTNQQYALKEYLVSGSSGQAQLQHESRVLSQLHHPNLPAFHKAFTERDHYYVVLSYIEGSDLTDLIRETRRRNEVIPLSRIMDWLLCVCDAVLFLHNHQTPVIHRDIKPDNIRITSNGTAILVDLGNAKAVADGARTLFFIRHQGTPGYAPQEQYPGGSGTDVRSDVYALGATLYFALTAHEPPSVSTRNQSHQQGLSDLPSLQEHLANNPPEDSAEANAGRQFRLGVSKPAKPARRHLRHLAQLGTLPPELLDQLNRIIKRAMAMKPKERYQSVADFSNDLRKVMGALPASPSPASSRSTDINRTQPDLPLLYDTLQEAKASIGQASGSSPAKAGTTPNTICSRCSAPLVAQAAFCPRCGSSLNNMFKAQIATVTVEPKVKTNTPSQHNSQSVHSSLADKSAMSMPQAQTPGTYTQRAPKPTTTMSPTSSSVQNMPAIKIHNQNKPAPGNPPPMPSTMKPREFNIQLALIIISVVLVVLIAIFIVLVVSQHGNIFHGLHHSAQQYALLLQAFSGI